MERFLGSELHSVKLKWDPNAEGSPEESKGIKLQPEEVTASLLETAKDDLDFDFSDMLADLRSELRSCKEQEERIGGEIERELSRIEEIYGSGHEFVHIFDTAVARLHTQLEPLEHDVGKLSGGLAAVQRVADDISSRVSALETAKGRVIECLQLVGDLRDLKVCAEGVQLAMKQEEYDEAAQHVHRFLTLDSMVFKMSERSEETDHEQSDQSMAKSYETLRHAASELKKIIEDKFDEAQKGEDFASMERFFKLFPLINEHSSGLQRFGGYLCGRIEKLGEETHKIMQAGGTDDRRKNVLYADTLTLLLEGKMIELYQPLIDAFYGPDTLLDLFEILQKSCDRQAVRIVSAFMVNRKVDQKAAQVGKYLNSRESTLLLEPSQQVEKIDAIDLDVLLAEATLMHTRTELYFRFLKRRLGQAPSASLIAEGKCVSRTTSVQGSSPTAQSHSKDAVEDVSDELFGAGETKSETREQQQSKKAERELKLDRLLHRSALSLKMQELIVGVKELIGEYILMEQYYMTESVRKAIEMDTAEDGSLTRSVSSSSVDCVCAIINNCITLLDLEFVKHISAPIKLSYPGVGLAAEITHTAINAWTATSATTEGGPERQRAAFLVALNNLQSAIRSMAELKLGLIEDVQRHLQMTPLEKSKLENSLGQFDEIICKKLEHYVNLSISKLVEAAFKPKLKSSAEIYLNISHSLASEVELAEYEESNPFVENYVSSLDGQLAQMEPLLTSENHQALIKAACAEAIYQFERVIFKCSFNRLGALQLDKDFRQLISYLTSLAGWSIREKSGKLSQIVNLLNSESIEEALSLAQHGLSLDGANVTNSLLLSSNDIRKIFLLRADFPRERVKAAKFGP